jgi:hypothetical protein
MINNNNLVPHLVTSRNNDGLRAGRPRFDSRQDEYLALLSNVQVGSGAHSASSPVGTGSDFPWSKAAEA